MQTLLIDNPDTLFFAGRAALLAIAFIAFATALGRWRRAGERDARELMERLEASREETRALVSLTGALAEQLAALGRRFDDQSRLAQASVATAGSGGGGIELAIRLARQGSDIEDIVKTCGVTRQEALLLARLHGGDATRAA